MKILVTGCAGFIGYHTVKQLLKSSHRIIGIDSLNSYYDVSLKKNRLKDIFNSITNDNFKFCKMDIANPKKLENLFKYNKFDIVINLAAQAGVRYSLINPFSYLKNNVIGFFNILENCRKFNTKHLIFASTSSAYGNNISPFKEDLKVDKPEQFYAATKISNEVMAYSYSKLYNIKTTGLRFFTVYGPWGRPDMALFYFTDRIIKNKYINVFNYGKHERDFTYIDDIVSGILGSIKYPPNKTKETPYRIINLGNNKKTKLMEFVKLIEKKLNKKAIIKYLPLQKGDIKSTCANIKNAKNKINYEPKTLIKTGVSRFIDWYRKYYNI
jgi:UDP-glucuronate 4-epimerase